MIEYDWKEELTLQLNVINWIFWELEMEYSEETNFKKKMLVKKRSYGYFP